MLLANVPLAAIELITLCESVMTVSGTMAAALTEPTSTRRTLKAHNKLNNRIKAIVVLCLEYIFVFRYQKIGLPARQQRKYGVESFTIPSSAM